MNPTLAGYLYLIAAALFIVGLRRLSSPATARSGNQLAATGMLVAVIVTLADRQILSYWVILAGLVVGSVVGVVLARRVEMTAMPQLVAVLNGFGGGASALVALVELGAGDDGTRTLVTVAISVLIGAVTFTGSMVAFAKLQGLVRGAPISYPGQRWGDLLLAAAALAAAIVLVASGGEMVWAWTTVAVTGLLGVTRVLPIGGADMPVVISFLNSASGLAASAAGFVIESNALVISGALVGAAGFILTTIMVKAMNRSLGDVLFGAFGVAPDQADADDSEKVARRATPEDVAIALAYARSVVVVPGYGLAVAQAQHAMRELEESLTARGVDVRYAIHPVAGRMPGHMNVLLAEADVDYERLYDLDDINRDFPHTDVALVVGANDVVNPLAREDPNSPIAGMPILDVDRADTVVVVKRSLSPGFAGIDNPLFYLENTMMLFADARQGLAEVTAAVKDA
ncbi:MAG TPA: NAD(P)(+) transhydrogenase (Re/Si-specific) subunit beta [Acidimicrobiia bacterium]|nr:NAD(P)(+) transhydrogenase (Re/Si-specific) subunit beta [Acidimicrobiia bacterium]